MLLLSLLMDLFDIPVMIESVLAFILDPVIARNKKFEEYLYKKAFERANRDIEE